MKTKLLAAFGLMILAVCAQVEGFTVSYLTQLAEVAARDGQSRKLLPYASRMAGYLVEVVLKQIQAGVDRSQSRPPVQMFVFRGDNNHFDLRELTWRT